jgi:hypothetical protein
MKSEYAQDIAQRWISKYVELFKRKPTKEIEILIAQIVRQTLDIKGVPHGRKITSS